MPHWKRKRTLQVQRALRISMAVQERLDTLSYVIFFMQDLIQNGILQITKISRETDPSDVFTTFLQADMLRIHIQRVGIVAVAFNQIVSIK